MKKKSDYLSKLPNKECISKTIVENRILRMLIKVLKTFAMKRFNFLKRGSDLCILSHQCMTRI